jgi:transposase
MLPPATPRRSHFISRDNRLRVQTLAQAGVPYARIAAQVGVTERQIGYSVRAPTTPQKRAGRPRILSKSQVQELILFVRQSRATRQMSWLALAQHFNETKGWNVTEYPIRYALREVGYTRRVALAKPPLSKENKQIRLQWAQDHVT